jgi:hypothetical protein
MQLFCRRNLRRPQAVDRSVSDLLEIRRVYVAALTDLVAARTPYCRVRYAF